ncbi:DNA alkylation repair protein [Chitinophaga sedimenti]|uniref:DNA alkylation repair protein n=1 Tax=Chitinophaga sedimenti TaxID=2033606 RepID=UPI0020061851|nr:DNA alkylation repair protein [Chitinophaga sedimenti]MCK7554282.1 DNA alkylation repair protein [Chitinophaga sedimenti]
MAALKDIYNPTFYKHLANALEQAVPGFNSKQFLKQANVPALAGMELKARMRHTTQVLHAHLSKDYPEALQQISSLIKILKQYDFADYSLAFIFLPDYIECYGLQHYTASVKALEEVTQFISCEFAVRPFLLKYGDKMLAQMEKWSKHKNHHVRRFASEGSRPKLPWAMAVPSLKQNPAPVLRILENLKDDPHPWVRKSVANNLNDISKDHPDLVLDVAARWKGLGADTDAIIKHGCRTLLKRGNTAILSHYQLDSTGLHFSEFRVLTPEVKTGGHLHFRFSVRNTAATTRVLRLEYAIYYRMQRDQFSKKVFKISEREIRAGESLAIERKQSFKIITTRKFYAGGHRVAVILNGSEQNTADFVLTLESD